MDSEFIEKPQMDPFVGGHFTMRHRFALEHLARHMQPGQLPKVLILESGIDSGIDAPWNIPSQGGWKSFTDISDYMSQIEWMHRHMSAEALIVFIMGTYYNEGAKWPTYDVWHPPEAREAFGQLIARLNGTTPPPPPPPDPQPGPDPCNPGDPVPSVVGGIDVSQHQGLIDWETVANSKTVERVIIRASSGTRTDRRFYENWSGAGAAGILRGAYHYLYPGDEAEQAYLFFRMADLLYPEIGYVLDVEQSGLTAANVLAFIEAWGRMSPAKLIIYTSPGLWHELIGHDAQWAKSHKLWVAHWDVDEPTLPDPWEDWVIWQYTVAPAGTIPGISTAIDLDWFRV
jgi:lysozyme